MVEASGVYKKHIIIKRLGEKAGELRKEDPTPQPFEIPPMLIITITFKNYNRCLSYLIVSLMTQDFRFHGASNLAPSRLAKRSGGFIINFPLEMNG